MFSHQRYGDASERKGTCVSQRVFDFTPAEQEVVVSRVLVHLHQAIDDAFPHARPASQRFAKTAFVGYDEPTLTQLVPSEALKEAGILPLANDSSDDATDIGPARPHSKPKPLHLSDEQPLSQEDGLGQEEVPWSSGRGMSLKQTLIGILTLILVALIAYLISGD